VTRPVAGRTAFRTGTVQVWTIPLDMAPRVIPGVEEILDAYEQYQALRFPAGQLRTRYIAAHVAVRRILGQCLTKHPGDVRLSRTASGKPYVSDAPLAFNLSHSGPLAVCAVTRSGSVGVDIEAMRAIDDPDGIVAHFFAPGEIAEYNRHSGESRLATFFRLWTRKEAYLKATGEGLSRPLNTFDVANGASLPARPIGVGGDDLTPVRWGIHSFSPAPGYIGALACEADSIFLDAFTWSDVPGLARFAGATWAPHA
jgi:4'-phosphopantetheinyl transferase